MSASDYACMHLINNSTMHGIDIGQPGLCRGIDFLSLISSHSLLAGGRNDELRQISDRGAWARGCHNPPPSPPLPQVQALLGSNPTDCGSPSMAGCTLINALISSFLVCFNDKRVPAGNLVTFFK